MKEYLDILADMLSIATFQYRRRGDETDFRRGDERLPTRPYRAWPGQGRGWLR